MPEETSGARSRLDLRVKTTEVPRNARQLLQETELVRTADGSDAYYMGTIPGGGGLAYASDRYMVSPLDEAIIAHELGHTMSLRRAPRGDPNSVESYYPYADGTIGSWGYDYRTDSLVSLETFDLMGYCKPVWTSAYHFTRAIRLRQTEKISFSIGRERTAKGAPCPNPDWRS